MSAPSFRSVSGTGHRWATRLNPDGLRPADRPWLVERARAGLEWFAERGATEAWVGLALGWDMLLGAAAVDLGMPLVAHIPYETQPSLWSLENRAEWARLRTAAVREVVYGSDPADKRAAVTLLHRRNDGLLRADALYAAWTGRRSGGTWSAIEKAQRLGLPGVHLEPTGRRVRVVEPGGWF